MRRPGFVGRERELATVGACLGDAAAGRSHVVWIEGEAGSGKTALVRAIIVALPNGYDVVRAEADELARDIPFDLLSQLGVTAAPDGLDAGFELLRRFGDRESDGPLVVVVEDLHWADIASRQALLTAARRLQDDRVVLILTTRFDPTVNDGWRRFVDDPDRCARIELEPMTVDEVRLLADASGISMRTADAERLHRHTRGHALYVRTLLAELTAEQLTGTQRELPAPRSLASTTVARMAELPAPARELAFALAVANQRIPLEIAGRIAGADDPTAALEPLLATGFVTWSPAEVGTPVEFAHPLYRSAVYDDLPPTRRQALHRAAAKLLSGDIALMHRVAAARSGDEALIDDVRAAARAATARCEHALAARDWLWASSLSGERGRAADSLLEAARSLLADHQVATALSLREQIMATEVSPLRSLVLGSLARAEGDAVSAERWFAEVERLSGGSPDDAEVRAAALAALGTLFLELTRGADAVAAGSKALALEPLSHSVEREASTAIAVGEGQLHGGLAGVERLDERLPKDPRRVRPDDATLLATRGILGFYAGRIRSPIADFEVALRLARRGGVAPHIPRGHLHLARLLVSAGDWDGALIHAQVARSLTADEHNVWIEAQVHATLCILAAGRGQWDDAERFLTSARQRADQLGTLEALFNACIAEAAIARARDDAQAVVKALGDLVGTGESVDMPMLTTLWWWSPLITGLIQTGELDTAARQIEQLERAAADRRLDLATQIAGLRAFLSDALGDAGSAEAHYEKAVLLASDEDPLVDRGLLHLAFGRFLVARGRRKEGVRELRAAHGLFSSVRADAYVERVSDELRRAGLTSGPDRDRTPLDLTDREQDVATLVARGLTNREIADELYVSVKAVEYHLRNIFGKLGITSRRELRDQSG